MSASMIEALKERVAGLEGVLHGGDRPGLNERMATAEETIRTVAATASEAKGTAEKASSDVSEFRGAVKAVGFGLGLLNIVLAAVQIWLAVR